MSGGPTQIRAGFANADGFHVEDRLLFGVPPLPRGYRPFVAPFESSGEALRFAAAVLGLVEYLSGHRGILSYHGWLWKVSSPRRTENLPQIAKFFPGPISPGGWPTCQGYPPARLNHVFPGGTCPPPR